MRGWPCRQSWPRWVSNDRFSCMSTTTWSTGLDGAAARARVGDPGPDDIHRSRAGDLHARAGAGDQIARADQDCGTDAATDGTSDNAATNRSPARVDTALVAPADVGARGLARALAGRSCTRSRSR